MLDGWIIPRSSGSSPTRPEVSCSRMSRSLRSMTTTLAGQRRYFARSRYQLSEVAQKIRDKRADRHNDGNQKAADDNGRDRGDHEVANSPTRRARLGEDRSERAP